MRPERTQRDAPAGAARTPVGGGTGRCSAPYRGTTILCGIDDASESRTAVVAAVRLAEALNARLVLAHVMPSPDAPPSGMASQRGLLRARAIEAGRRLLGEAAGELLDDTRTEALEGAQTRVDFGDPARRLATVADEIEAGMIVVGTRGRGLPKVALAGSVSQTLAAEESRPILIVPADTEIANRARRPSERGGSPIVCGVDGSDGATGAARVAAGLASSLGRGLILAHSEVAEAPTAGEAVEFGDVLDPEARPRVLMLKRASEVTGDAETELRLLSGDPAVALEELGARESAELIAVGTRGHSVIRALALGSISRALAESSSRPVLVVNDP